MSFIKHSVNGSLVSVIEIRDSATIGRGASNNIVVEDPTISASHARIYLENDVWKIKDCGSTNGVNVQGKKIDEAVLHEGFIFSLGTQDFEFCLECPSGLDQTLKIKKSWIPGVYYT